VTGGVKDPGPVVVESEPEGELSGPESGSMGLTIAVGELEPATGSIGLTITPTVLGASRMGSESRLG
jgi:hypothetical protein